MTTIKPEFLQNRVGDVISVGAILGSLAGWLPPLAALAAIIWYSIEIYESATVQKIVKRWRKTS